MDGPHVPFKLVIRLHHFFCCIIFQNHQMPQVGFYITELEKFQQNICNGCGMPSGDADSSGHLVPSLWDLHMFYLLRPILSELVVILPDYAHRISLGTFSIFLFTMHYTSTKICVQYNSALCLQ